MAGFEAIHKPESHCPEISTDLGVITWNNEIDIAPETAYSLVAGTPLPAWMEKSKNIV